MNIDCFQNHYVLIVKHIFVIFPSLFISRKFRDTWYLSKSWRGTWPEKVWNTWIKV